MKFMKIPNKAVLALAAVWPLLGWLAVPTWTAWLWGFALMAIVLVAGFLLNTDRDLRRGRRQIRRRHGAVLRRCATSR